ncbi:hypothetical protein VS893_24590, partial [Shigella flexneri]|nr:hypothetical protein [Shigella flexneri]
YLHGRWAGDACLTAIKPHGKLGFASFPEAGSALYHTRKKSINPHVGFMVGWSSLLDYLFAWPLGGRCLFNRYQASRQTWFRQFSGGRFGP